MKAGSSISASPCLWLANPGVGQFAFGDWHKATERISAFGTGDTDTELVAYRALGKWKRPRSRSDTTCTDKEQGVGSGD